MEGTGDIVKSLGVDIEAIISVGIESKKQVTILHDKNLELKTIVEQHKNEIEVLKEKNKLIKIAKSLDGSANGDSSELKLKINEILREVDRCVALLNK